MQRFEGELVIFLAYFKLNRAIQALQDLSLNKIGQNGAKGIRFELGFDSKEGKSILTEVNQAFSSAKGRTSPVK